MAVSRDEPSIHARLEADLGLPFPLLSDPELKLVKALGMVHEKAGPGGTDIARPGTFVIDREGRVTALFVSTRVRERVDPRDVLEAVKTVLKP